MPEILLSLRSLATVVWLRSAISDRGVTTLDGYVSSSALTSSASFALPAACCRGAMAAAVVAVAAYLRLFLVYLYDRALEQFVSFEVVDGVFRSMKVLTRDEGSRTVIGLLRPLTMSRRYCGIEAAKVLDVDVEHLGNLLQMKVFVDNHGVGLNRQFGHHRTDVVVAIVVHDVVGCDEGWHISACLLGEVGIDVPVIGRTFGAVDGLADLVAAYSCRQR